jgi:hypothetical protein
MLQMPKTFRIFCTVENLEADAQWFSTENKLIVYGMTVAPLVQWILFSQLFDQVVFRA